MFVYLHVCIVNSQAVIFLAWDGEGEVCKDGSLQVKKRNTTYSANLKDVNEHQERNFTDRPL
jgi:hypothetical protein